LSYPEFAQLRQAFNAESRQKAYNYRPSCKRTVSGSNPLTGSTHQPAKTDPANLTLGSAYSSKVQQ